MNNRPTEATHAAAAALGRLFRALPTDARGKGRLARSLLTHQARSTPIVVSGAGGSSLFLPNLHEPVAFSYWMNGCYEPETLAFLKRVCDQRPQSALIDVGANIGVFSVPMARHLASTGRRVLALEASPPVASILRSNIDRNQLRNVTVLECAASNGESETVPFYVAPEDKFGMGSTAPQFGAKPIPVAAKTLDKVIQEAGGGDIGAIKVDVEGYEAHVFEGAAQLLAGPHPPAIVFEFCDWAEERAFPGQCGWAQQILLDHGYRLWRIADYLAGRTCFERPLTKGFESIAAIHESPGE